MPSSGAANLLPRTVKVEHWSPRECATLGANFRDVYLDGELWASEVPKDLAERFCREAWLYGNVHAPTPKLRTLVLEWEDAGARLADIFYPATNGVPGRRLCFTRGDIASRLNDHLAAHSQTQSRFTADDNRLTAPICQEFADRWATMGPGDDEAELCYDLLVHRLDVDDLDVDDLDVDDLNKPALPPA